MKLDRIRRYLGAKLLPRRQKAKDQIGKQYAEEMVRQGFALSRQKLSVDNIPPTEEVRELVALTLRRVERFKQDA